MNKGSDHEDRADPHDDLRAATPGRIEKGEIDPRFVISHRVPIDSAPEMYKVFRDKEDYCTKVVLESLGNRTRWREQVDRLPPKLRHRRHRFTAVCSPTELVIKAARRLFGRFER